MIGAKRGNSGDRHGYHVDRLAQGIKDFQDIVSEGISERLLRWKGIEATVQLAESENSKVIVIGQGDDGLPIILGNQ